MNVIGQALSLAGLFAVAALIVLVIQGLGAGGFDWGRAALALMIALGCFWGAARAARR